MDLLSLNNRTETSLNKSSCGQTRIRNIALLQEEVIGVETNGLIEAIEQIHEAIGRQNERDNIYNLHQTFRINRRTQLSLHLVQKREKLIELQHS